MADSLYEFVAEDAWFAAIFATIALGVVASAANLESVAGLIFTLGFVFVMPVLMFWGEEVADLLVGEPPEHADRAGADADVGDGSGEAGADPLEEFKRRYAAGEIDEIEFERRLERLLALDGVEADDADLGVLLEDGREATTGASGRDATTGVTGRDATTGVTGRDATTGVTGRDASDEIRESDANEATEPAAREPDPGDADEPEGEPDLERER